MGEDIVVKLESDEEEYVEKWVEDCRDKTFEEVVDYLLDPSSDEWNPEYKEEMKRTCLEIREKKRRAESSPQESFALTFRDESGDESGRLNLSKKVRDYPDAIYPMQRDTGGGTLNYNGMRLVERVNRVGG